MKNTLPYHHHRSLILAALAAALPLANSANAQDPALPAATATSKTASSILPKADFDNQKFGDVVEQLRASSGLNIVLQPSLADAKVRRMHVKNASALCILFALAGDLNAKIVQVFPSEKGKAYIYRVVGQDEPGIAFDPGLGTTPMDLDADIEIIVANDDSGTQLPAGEGTKVLPSVETEALSFSGLIDYLNSKTDANFFLGAELGALDAKVVPALKLQNVSAVDVINVVGRILNISVETRWITSSEKGSKDIYWVKRRAVPKPDKNARDARTTMKMRVYNLRGMEIDGEKDLDKMMAALSDVVEESVRKQRRMNSRNYDDLPKLDLHKATKLLFVTAPEDDFNILEQIITALGGKTEGAAVTPASETVKEQP